MSSYYNRSRIILDGSYNTNAPYGSYASTIQFQSQSTSGGWITNALFKNTSSGSIIAVNFYFYGTVFYYGLSALISDETTKTDIIIVDNPLDKIQQIKGVYFTSLCDNSKRMGVLAQDVQKVVPEVISTDDNGKMGVCYSSLIGLLIEGIKELNNKINNSENRIKIFENK